MKNHTHTIKWATDYLTATGYSLVKSPEIVAETPWSHVIRFSTSKEDIYLKATPPSLFLEPKIMQLLADELHASVPVVIASNDDLHCFLMKDAGTTLRQYLKRDFQPGLLCDASREYATIQQLTENHVAAFLALGVPDWRLDKLPDLYNQLINQTAFLKSDGITDEELKILHDLSHKMAEQCELLSHFHTPATLVQPDFNTNNMLFDLTHKKMTLIDLGEIAITHPFFSLENFLFQATVHHGVKESDPIYLQLQNIYFENWLARGTKKQLLEEWMLVKQLLPIYSALAHYRLMMGVELQALKSYYAHKPNQLAGHLREYMISNRKV